MEEETKKVEEYLVETVNRLFDVTMALEANLIYCKTRKEALLNNGKGFEYDQGRIDAVTEVLKFASGEVKMQDVVEVMDQVQAKQKEEKRAAANGMVYG